VVLTANCGNGGGGGRIGTQVARHGGYWVVRGERCVVEAGAGCSSRVCREDLTSRERPGTDRAGRCGADRDWSRDRGTRQDSYSRNRVCCGAVGGSLLRSYVTSRSFSSLCVRCGSFRAPFAISTFARVWREGELGPRGARRGRRRRSLRSVRKVGFATLAWGHTMHVSVKLPVW
jgi:hypothetical protein